MVSLRGLTLTAARPRIIVPLFARDPAALCPLAKAASADPAAELVELRLDPLPAGRSSSRGSYFSVQPASSVTDGVSKVSTRRMLAPRAVSLP